MRTGNETLTVADVDVGDVGDVPRRLGILSSEGLPENRAVPPAGPAVDPIILTLLELLRRHITFRMVAGSARENAILSAVAKTSPFAFGIYVIPSAGSDAQDAAVKAVET